MCRESERGFTAGLVRRVSRNNDGVLNSDCRSRAMQEIQMSSAGRGFASSIGWASILTILCGLPV